MPGPSQDRPFEEPHADGPPVREGAQPERNAQEGAAGQLPGPAGTPTPRQGERPSPIEEARRDAHPDRDADRRTPGAAAPAGPHAQPSLTNEDATPGAGTLPEAGEDRAGRDIDADASTG